MEHLELLNSVSVLPCALRNLPESFDLQATISWHPHESNTVENLDYKGPMRDISYYGVNEMSGGERKEFLAWYETRKSDLFHNRHVLQTYSQDEVTVLLQVCRVFRREILQIWNIEVFVESQTIASACNKVLRRKCLKPDTIGRVPTCNNKYSKKLPRGCFTYSRLMGWS